MNKVNKSILSVLAVFAIAFISSFFTMKGVNGWYQTAVHGVLTPPRITFRIVWTILYILMAISICKINIIETTENKKKAQYLFWLQLLLHIPWCFSFFYMGYLGLGLLIILIMDFIAYLTIKSFKTIDKASAYLLYPYFIWICFASVLNLSYIINNGLSI